MTAAVARSRWSIRLGLVRGVPVDLHASSGLLFVWIALQAVWSAGLTGLFYAPEALLSDPGYLAGLIGSFLQAAREVLLDAFMLALIFGCILLHELGHTFQAQRLGIPVRRILLLPFGGLAELARVPDRPRDELRVALAGPAANVGLALILGGLAGLWLVVQPLPLRLALALALNGAGALLFEILFSLALANAAITVFNLLPAFPLDGGRIARSLLAIVLPRLQATSVVTGLSWLCAAALVWVSLQVGREIGFSTGLSLLFMAGIILLGGGHERAQEENRLALEEIDVRRAVRQPTWTLSPTDAINSDLLGAFFLRPALPVVVDSRLVGLVAREDLTRALKGRQIGRVAHLMQTRFPYLRAGENLWQAYQLFFSAGVSILPVLEGDQLLGMLTAADVRAARFAPPGPPPEQAPTFIAGGNPAL